MEPGNFCLAPTLTGLNTFIWFNRMVSQPVIGGCFNEDGSVSSLAVGFNEDGSASISLLAKCFNWYGFETVVMMTGGSMMGLTR